jgi:outer membrane protein
MRIVLLFFIVFVTNAQIYTVQQCIEIAVNNNLQIKQSELNAESASSNYFQSKANLLPSINASASQGYNFGRSVDPFTNLFTESQIRSNNFAGSANMDIWNGLQNVNNIRRSRAEYLAGMHDLNRFKNDIALNVSSMYLQVLFAEDQLINAKNAQEASKLQRERIEKMVKAGASPEGMLLDMKAQAATDELNVINTQNTLEMARLNLFQLMEMAPNDAIKFERPVVALNSESLLGMSSTAIYETALENQPAIKNAEERINSAKYGYYSSIGALSPRLSVSGNVFTGYSSARQKFVGANFQGFSNIGFLTNDPTQTVSQPNFVPEFGEYAFNDQLKDNVSKSINFQLSIPIFNKYQVRNNINLNRIGVKNSEYNLQNTKNQLRKTIEQAYLDAKAAARKLDAVQIQLEALDVAFSNAEKRFNNGALNFTDYTIARNNKLRALADLTQARYDLFFKIKVLEFYQGSPLSF